MSEWSKDPWIYRLTNEGCIIDSKDMDAIGEMVDQIDAQRAVQCVNALAGIENPEEVVKEMIGFIEDFVSTLRASPFPYLPFGSPIWIKNAETLLEKIGRRKHDRM